MVFPLDESTLLKAFLFGINNPIKITSYPFLFTDSKIKKNNNNKVSKKLVGGVNMELDINKPFVIRSFLINDRPAITNGRT